MYTSFIIKQIERMIMWESLKNKSQSMLWVYIAVLVPMWLVFMVNNAMLGHVAQSGGVFPRTVSMLGIFGIFTSWMLHADWQHIIGNTQILLSLLFFVALIEKNPLTVIISLITVSGVFTWFLGAPNTMHIGASGLVFALLGYLFASIVFAKRWLYIIALFAMSADYLYCIKSGLIPQESISFAAHFGGLIGGVFVAYVIGKVSKTPVNNDNISLVM